MLCRLCASIDFSNSDVQVESSAKFDHWTGLQDGLKLSERNIEYYTSSHHPSIRSLCKSAEQGCQFCVKIRSELLNIRGHESDEEYHSGYLEVRYYPHIERVDKNGFRWKEIFVVAKTFIADFKLGFDFAQYEGKFLDSFCPLWDHQMGLLIL
jgi:hypothetical protein